MSNNNYVPLDVRSVPEFAEAFLEGEPVEASEIGDDNPNEVFRVRYVATERRSS